MTVASPPGWPCLLWPQLPCLPLPWNLLFSQSLLGVPCIAFPLGRSALPPSRLSSPLMPFPGSHPLTHPAGNESLIAASRGLIVAASMSPPPPSSGTAI